MGRHVINLEDAKLNIFVMLQQRTSIDDQIVCDLRIFVSFISIYIISQELYVC